MSTLSHNLCMSSLNSLNACASSLKARIVCVFPSGNATVTVTIFTSASEPKTGGCILFYNWQQVISLVQK
jgi:hypothetical protein